MSEPFQILAPDGTPVQPELLPKDHSEIIRLYKQMVRIRYFDERAITLNRQGKMGTYPPFGGQEASQVGTAGTLMAQDYVVPMYRNTGSLLAYGWPIHKAILYWRTHPEGWKIPDNLNFFPIDIDIASQFPHATGAALASKLKGEDRVAMSYIGEGGTSQGDFHAGINFAAATGAPAIFVIENNGWAISTPRVVQGPSSGRLSDRAIGYGIPGYHVDGNDLLAVQYITQKAIQDARDGKGPSLIENMTYRIKPHTTTDDPNKYRKDKEDEVRDWTENKDPVKRVYNYLVDHAKLWDAEQEAAWLDAVKAEFESELALADATPAPDPEDLFEHLMGIPTPQLIEQREELRRRLGR